jgi:hypothetical protein
MLLIDISYSYKSAHERVEGREKTPNPYQVVNTYSTHVIGFEYGLTEILDLIVTVPWSNNYREFTIPDTGDWFRYRSNGLGDISVVGKAFVTRNELVGFAEFGLSLPTGTSDERNEFGYIPSFIQTGSGLYVPIVGLGSNWSTGKWYTFASIRYIMAGAMGTNDAGYKFQNQTRWSIGTLFTANRSFTFGLKADGLAMNGWDTRDGVQVANTGGRWISLTPSISYLPVGDYSFTFSYMKPVYWNTHSNQAMEDHEVRFSISLVY